MPRHFDDFLPRINADKIKPMVKMWGGASTKMTKPDYINLIIASLQPWERNALALSR